MWHGKFENVLFRSVFTPTPVGRLARSEGGPGKPDFVSLTIAILPSVFADAILQPIYAPSAIPARGGKYRHLPDQPGHGTVRLFYICLSLPLK